MKPSIVVVPGRVKTRMCRCVHPLGCIWCNWCGFSDNQHSNPKAKPLITNLQNILDDLTRGIAAGTIDPNEPAFLLRGTDPLAPELTREWARRAKAFGVTLDKVKAARAQSDAIDDWQTDDRGRIKVPT